MASNGFNITPSINLDGVSDFKNQVKQVSSQIALINSDFKANAAEMKASGKTVEGLEKNLKNLEMVYDAENKKLDIYQKELENIVATQGENSKAAIDMQIKVNQQAAAVSKAKDNLNQYAKEMDDSANETKKFGDEADKSGGKALKLGDIIKANLISDAIKAGLGALVDGIKGIGSAMTSTINEGRAYADNILTLSSTTGIATDKLQQYQNIAELSDVSLETLTGTMAKITKTAEKNADKYKELGINVKDSNGHLKDNEQIFSETIDALGKVDNETERDALAMELLGKSAQDLNPIIKMGAENFDKLSESFSHNGTLTEEALDNLGQLDDYFQVMNLSMSSVTKGLAAGLAPALNGLMGPLADITSLFGEFFTEIGNGEAADPEAFIGPIEEALDGLLNNLENDFIPKINELVQRIIPLIVKFVETGLPKLLSVGAELIQTLLKGIISAIQTLAPVVTNILLKIVEIIIQNLPMIITAGVQILTSLIQGIAEALPTLIPEIVNALILIVTTLLDNIDMIIDAGIQLIMGLADGLIEALPILIDKIPEIIDKLIMAITNNLPKIIEAGIILIIKLAEGLIKAIPQLVSKIPEIIGSLINGIKNYFSKMVSIGGELLDKVKEGLSNGISKIFDVGKNLVKGLWDGINNAKDWVLDKIKGFGKGILDGIKGFFGIHSPSRVFRDQIGANLAKGLGLGFEDEMKDVTKDMTSSIPTDFDVAMNARVNKNGSVSGQNPYGTGTNIVQNITVNSPQPLNPTETAREIEKMSRELAWGL